MKMKLLSLAVMAGLAAAGSAQAMHVNPDGLGEVLLYPYYTVEGGYDSYVQVVNTTNEAKAVKVRFLEGKNSQEVLDFNLYLSPYDVWTGVLTKSANGTLLTTTDTSCTSPAIPAAGVEFRNSLFSSDSVGTTARTREGYVEMIEMGNLEAAALITAVTHVNGTPADCGAIRSASIAPSTTAGSLNDRTSQASISEPTGGLYGYAVYINGERGLDFTADAVAIDDFFARLAGVTEHLHAVPGDENPSLVDGNTNALIFDGTNVYTYAVGSGPLGGASGADAVSALLMHDSIMNSYQTAPEVAGATDWVVTFPTKRFYVANNGDADLNDAVTPFDNEWDPSTSTSCEAVVPTYFDREEREQGADPIDFSPSTGASDIQICNEVNTISFNALGQDSVFAATTDNTRANINVDYTAGWMRMTFSNLAGTNPASTSGLPGAITAVDADGVAVTDGADVILGLPVIGFASDILVNNTLSVGGVTVLSNYGGSTVHKASRDITP